MCAPGRQALYHGFSRTGPRLRQWFRPGREGAARHLYPVQAGLVLVILVSAGGGCSWAPKVHGRVQVELAHPDSFLEGPTNVTGRITFAEASRRWAERDPETMQQVTKALAEGVDVAEAKSWVWPRADIEFHEIVANERNDSSVSSAPSGGLVLRYDFKKFLFRGDAAAVSAARRDLFLQKARLAIDSALGRFEDLVIEWRQLQEALPLEDQRVAEFRRLMEAVHSLDELGVLPAGSFAEWKHREQVALREQSEVLRRRKSVLESLHTELGLAADSEPELGSLDFLLKVPPLPERPAGEGEVRQWLPSVWQSHGACRIAEDELFQAEMAVIGAKRERLPRLTGSVGLGNIDTWVGTQLVEANAIAEIGISMPIFDAGTISRGVEKSVLNRNLARRNVRMQAQSLAREVQSASGALRAAHVEVEHRRAECEEVRRLADTAGRSAGIGQGDPLLPFALRVYRLEAERGASEANVKLAKAWRAYRVAVGEPPVPGLASSILDGLVRDFGKNNYAGRK